MPSVRSKQNGIKRSLKKFSPNLDPNAPVSNSPNQEKGIIHYATAHTTELDGDCALLSQIPKPPVLRIPKCNLRQNDNSSCGISPDRPDSTRGEMLCPHVLHRTATFPTSFRSAGPQATPDEREPARCVDRKSFERSTSLARRYSSPSVGSSALNATHGKVSKQSTSNYRRYSASKEKRNRTQNDHFIIGEGSVVNFFGWFEKNKDKRPPWYPAGLGGSSISHHRQFRVSPFGNKITNALKRSVSKLKVTATSAEGRRKSRTISPPRTVNHNVAKHPRTSKGECFKPSGGKRNQDAGYVVCTSGNASVAPTNRSQPFRRRAQSYDLSSRDSVLQPLQQTISSDSVAYRNSGRRPNAPKVSPPKKNRPKKLVTKGNPCPIHRTSMNLRKAVDPKVTPCFPVELDPSGSSDVCLSLDSTSSSPPVGICGSDGVKAKKYTPKNHLDIVTSHPIEKARLHNASDQVNGSPIRNSIDPPQEVKTIENKKPEVERTNLTTVQRGSFGGLNASIASSSHAYSNGAVTYASLWENSSGNGRHSERSSPTYGGSTHIDPVWTILTPPENAKLEQGEDYPERIRSVSQGTLLRISDVSELSVDLVSDPLTSRMCSPAGEQNCVDGVEEACGVESWSSTWNSECEKELSHLDSPQGVATLIDGSPVYVPSEGEWEFSQGTSRDGYLLAEPRSNAAHFSPLIRTVPSFMAHGVAERRLVETELYCCMKNTVRTFVNEERCCTYRKNRRKKHSTRMNLTVHTHRQKAV